jgi:thioredoxin-like negative regulator of GroEL
MEFLLDKLKATKSNTQFFESMKRQERVHSRLEKIFTAETQRTLSKTKTLSPQRRKERQGKSLKSSLELNPNSKLQLADCRSG